MFFKRKKDIDLRDLQRKGLIRIPKKEVEVKTDKRGFIDLVKNDPLREGKVRDSFSSSKSEPGFFNFMEPISNSRNDVSQPIRSEEKREMIGKIEEMNSKIYKLEQRIELLERKTGINNSSEYNW